MISDNSSFIDKNVIIEKNVFIGPFCCIQGDVIIKENTKLISHVSIGAPPQYKYGKQSGGQIIIGQNTEVREFVVINAPVDKLTYIGNNCLLMSGCHIPHDCYINDYSVISSNATLAGYTTLGKHTTLGIGSSMKQYSKFDDYCFLGAGSFFKGISPKAIIWAGVPAKPIKVNLICLEREIQDKYLKEELIKNAQQFLLDNKKEEDLGF